MTHRGVRTATAVATVLAAAGASAGASAQQWQLDARGGLGTGIESGDPGSGSIVLRRARTRLMIAVEATIDERPENAYELVVFAELEPHTGLGGELRLSRDLGASTRAFVGAVGVVAPHTLFGGGFGFRILGDSWSSLFIEPSLTVLPFGTDLAGDRILVWGLLSVGLHGSL